MSKLKELREKRKQAYQAAIDLDQSVENRLMSSEELAQWEKHLDEYQQLDKQIELEVRNQEIERKRAEEIAQTQVYSTPTDEKEYRAAVVEYLLRGSSSMSVEARTMCEKRDIEAVAGLTGGVLVPKDLASQIETAIKSYGGILSAAHIFTTDKGGDLTLPTVNDTTNKAMVVAQYEQSTAGSPVFGSETLRAFTYRTPLVPISLEMLQDSSFNLEQTIGSLLADCFGRGLNEDFTVGSGVEKPKGILHWATASQATPSASAIKLDDIIDLIASVDQTYAKAGKLMLNRQTFYSLIKIKDTTGRYIWQDSVGGSTPPTLFNKEYIINDDIPGIGAGNASVMFGDFNKFKVRMVRNFRVVRLNEILADRLAIGLFGFARADCALLDAGTHPVVKLVHGT